MVPVAVFDKLLFPVLACVYRWFQVSDRRSLLCRAKRAESGINIVSLLFYRAVIDTVNTLNEISSGKPETCRMSWFLPDDHAESGK